MWSEQATSEQKRRHALALVALSTDPMLLAAAERVVEGGEVAALVEAIMARAALRQVTLDATDLQHLVRSLIGVMPTAAQTLPNPPSLNALSPLLPALERVADRFSIVQPTLHQQVAEAAAQPDAPPPSTALLEVGAATDADLLIDPELARLAIALGHGRAFAVFTLAQQMTRARGGGVIE